MVVTNVDGNKERKNIPTAVIWYDKHTYIRTIVQGTKDRLASRITVFHCVWCFPSCKMLCGIRPGISAYLYTRYTSFMGVNALAHTKIQSINQWRRVLPTPQRFSLLQQHLKTPQCIALRQFCESCSNINAFRIGVVHKGVLNSSKYYQSLL